MIQKVIKGAAFLLILQIGLVILALNTATSGFETEPAASFFPKLDGEKVTLLNISGLDNKKLTLVRTDSGWIMKNAYGAPAAAAQVSELLGKLAAGKKGLAVAVSSGSAKRFKTADNHFERHVIIKAGDSVVADFYLGTSAGFRNSHVRESGEDAVYSLPVSNYELSTEPGYWLDKNLAKLDRGKVRQIKVNGLTLTKANDTWSLTAPVSAAVDQKQVQTLLDTVAELTVKDVFDPAAVSSLFTEGAVKRITVSLADGVQLTYALVKKGDDYILKKSNSDFYFKVMAPPVKTLLETSREKLIPKSTESVADKASAAKPEGSPGIDNHPN